MKPLPDKKKDGFKTGANKLDQNAIKTLGAEGVEAKEISQRLKIKLECVKSWLPKPKKKVKKTKED